MTESGLTPRMTMRPVSWRLLFPVLIALTSGAMLLAILAGSVPLSVEDIWTGLLRDGDSLAKRLVVELRWPRAVAAFTTGGTLAVAGALMQVLLRNPLADPYILGISGGAAVAALLAMLLGLAGFWIDLGAFAGALSATLLVFALAHARGGWTPMRLLLTGVVLAAGFSAMISLLLALGPDTSLRGMLFWLMGDLSYAERIWPSLLTLLAAVLGGLAIARHLNVLARGELQAQILGVAVRPLRIGIYIASSLLTAVAVTTAGSIGFVGLITPHLLRLVAGSDHRMIIPGAALLGGTLLVVADTAARTVLAPRQLPVGALTALIGVPLFLVLMTRLRSVN